MVRLCWHLDLRKCLCTSQVIRHGTGSHLGTSTTNHFIIYDLLYSSDTQKTNSEKKLISFNLSGAWRIAMWHLRDRT